MTWVGSWKSLIIIKEIMKLRGILLRVWDKNQLLFEFLGKFKHLDTKISMENWYFTHFLSDLPGPLSFYRALKKHFINIFRFRGESFNFPSTPGAPLWFKTFVNARNSLILWSYYSNLHFDAYYQPCRLIIYIKTLPINTLSIYQAQLFIY